MAILALVTMACSPIRASDFETPARPTLGAGDVVLDLGRRYAVVASGTGVPLREAPNPTAKLVDQLSFASVVSTTGETSGTDGKTWRKIENRGWSPRDGLLVFDDVQKAVSLAIELRVFSPPQLRQRVLARDSLGAPPDAPQAAAVTSVTPSVYYAVVLVPQTRYYVRPGIEPADRPPVPVGTVVTVTQQGVGDDRQPALRTEENLWLPLSSVAVYSTLTEATHHAFDAIMSSLAPGVHIDRDIAPALWLMHREPSTRYLAETIASEKIPIRIAKVADPKQIANYNFADRAITVSDRYANADVRALAASLVHEATHAWEHAQGLRPQMDSAACFEAELRAFRNQAMLWETFHGKDGLESATGDAEREQNEVLRLIQEDPQALKLILVDRYGDQCGYTGPRPNLPADKAEAPAEPKPGAKPAKTDPSGKPPAAPPRQAKPGGPAPQKPTLATP